MQTEGSSSFLPGFYFFCCFFHEIKGEGKENICCFGLPDGVRFLSLRFFFFLSLCIHLASFSEPPYSSIYGNYVAEDQKDFFFPCPCFKRYFPCSHVYKDKWKFGMERTCCVVFCAPAKARSTCMVDLPRKESFGFSFTLICFCCPCACIPVK